MKQLIDTAYIRYNALVKIIIFKIINFDYRRSTLQSTTFCLNIPNFF